MEIKKIVSVFFQKRMVQKYNNGVEDVVEETIPCDRVSIRYVTGDEEEILHNGDLLDNVDAEVKSRSINISELNKDELFEELKQVLEKYMK